MPINKSQLEARWYYRVAKVMAILLPFIAIAYLIAVSDITFSKIDQTWFMETVQKNQTGIITAILGLIGYFIAITLLWKLLLYIVFGGLTDDTLKNPEAKAGLNPKDKQEVTVYIILLVILAVFYFAYTAHKDNLIKTNRTITDTTRGTKTDTSRTTENTNNENNTYTDNKNTGCIPTGCGVGWRCDGYYYVENVSINVHACLPRRANEIYSSWVGTCRQCP